MRVCMCLVHVYYVVCVVSELSSCDYFEYKANPTAVFWFQSLVLALMRTQLSFDLTYSYSHKPEIVQTIETNLSLFFPSLFPSSFPLLFSAFIPLSCFTPCSQPSTVVNGH